jgi:AcrR family transcriptional regulator
VYHCQVPQPGSRPDPRADRRASTPREALLEAAARLLAEKGPDALTTRRLAAEIGASTMAVYTWFGNMPNLMRALYRECFVRFGDHLRAVPTTADCRADLQALSLAYRSFALDNPNFYEIMFGHYARAFTPDDEDVALALSTLTILVDGVARCTEEGYLVGEAGGLALQMWAAAHGAVSLELAMLPGSPLFASGQVYQAVVSSLFAGMAPGPGGGGGEGTTGAMGEQPAAARRGRWRRG